MVGVHSYLEMGLYVLLRGGLFLRPKINIDQLSCNLIYK